MTTNPNRWLMRDGEQPLVTDDAGSAEPGADEVVVEIDACSLWHSNVGFQFGDVHASSTPATQPRVSGHVVEAGDNALFYIDREVTLSTTVPCGKQNQCWTGGTATCPNKPADGSCAHGEAPSIVAPARNVSLAEKHQPASLGPGLTPFKDG